MNLKLILSLAFLSAMVAGKNVVNLQDFKIALEEEGGNEKREAKNVVDLNGFKEALEHESGNQKRDAKNVVNLEDFKIALQQPGKNQKRDAKNVVNLNDFKITKRDAKNVINLNDFKIAVKSDTKVKRKNVVDLAAFKAAVESEGSNKKRSVEQFLFKIDLEDSKENILQSVLPQIKAISIMSGYIRDNEAISAKTELTNETMIIIAPTDNAITNKLDGFKPWEFPRPIVDADDETVEKILKYNLNSFLSHHIVENFEQNLEIDQNSKVIETRLLNGNVVRIKQDQVTDKFSLQTVDKKSGKSSNWINVDTVKQVDNGFIFVIDESLVKP
ncbi:uncharacterized protein RJT20DRAFT_135031 [Scheffersomyces xylosifermentans]|uniref:uncharacterized protein n=1 Tax=Scheffersomyces xylosifermentans TaxID=1304137 RepID=UPI00315D23F1